MFKIETAKDRKIRELCAEIDCLNRKIIDERQAHKDELSNVAYQLAKEQAKNQRSAFAEKIGLLPCESPACEACKNAVWYNDADGRHIAGCRKGIQCADFVEAEPQKEASAPVSVNVMTPYPVGVPISSPYSPISSALGLPRW